MTDRNYSDNIDIREREESAECKRLRITVVPQGGLCNRLRTVLSAFFAAQKGADVRVEWACIKECKADFHDLFEPLSLSAVEVNGQCSQGGFSITPRRWWNRPQSRWNLHVPALLRRMIYDEQWVNLQRAEGKYSIEHVYKNIYISTGYEWYPYDPKLSRLLRPVAEIGKRIDELSANFDVHTVGVHIRRTDNVVCMRHSTDEAFVEAMRKAVEEDGDTRFYVATDDLDVLKKLQDTFHGRIMHQPLTDVRRDTCEGIRQAVVDLFCLAHCRRLLGSYWSSFTDMAAEIGGVEPHIVGKPERG